MEEKIVKILNEMSEYLSITQMKKLQEVILKVCAENEAGKMEISNTDFLRMFLDAKKIEGCSERTIQYYKVTVEHLLSHIETSVRKITTEEIRTYLAEYQKNNKCSNVTVDNIRRNISSFFSWLEEEDYILKSPMKRIHKIKTKTVVKSVITDEGIERLRDNCKEIRDLAIIDLLYSTGIRVGELVNLNVDDIDLEERYDEIKEKYGVPKVGDILIAAIGATIGYSWIVDSENPFYYKDGNIIILSIKDNVNPIFLNHTMRILIDDFKNKGVAGSAQLALTIEKLEKMMVINPPIELQNRFADFVRAIDKSKFINQLL